MAIAVGASVVNLESGCKTLLATADVVGVSVRLALLLIVGVSVSVLWPACKSVRVVTNDCKTLLAVMGVSVRTTCLLLVSVSVVALEIYCNAILTAVGTVGVSTRMALLLSVGVSVGVFVTASKPVPIVVGVVCGSAGVSIDVSVAFRAISKALLTAVNVGGGSVKVAVGFSVGASSVAWKSACEIVWVVADTMAAV